MNPAVHIDAAWRSLFHWGEELCGDRVMIRRSDTSFLLVLADGLGSGVKANILSTLTSTIISEMIFEGLSLRDAVDTIAATLPVCSDRNVAYSTFTILKVDYDGNARLVQYDNPRAVIIRGGQVLHVPQISLEVSGKAITVSEFKVQPDDHIMMFSDGILYAGTEMKLNYDWDQEAVEDFLAGQIQPDDTPAEAVRILLAVVNSLYGGMPGDDCTAADVHIIPARETVLLAGPPVRKEDDEKVLGILMKASGKKIVCGGTTSQIVARYLNEEIIPDTETPMLADVPPKAYIRGIDLVTEGLLTLQKTSRYLRRACEDMDYYEELQRRKDEDGASCLVRALASSGSVRIILGMSQNEGHENLGPHISAEAKRNVIEEIAGYLEKLGKIVSVEIW